VDSVIHAACIQQHLLISRSGADFLSVKSQTAANSQPKLAFSDCDFVNNYLSGKWAGCELFRIRMSGSS